MAYTQTITPNPTVACQPGYCLKYVQDAFGLGPVYPTATAAWNASNSKHQDRSFPPGCWLAVWFKLATVPAGHVALLAPDGSVWSSSDPNTNVPHQHPSLDALIQYYAKANPLTYLGWTEDVEGTLVVKQGANIVVEDTQLNFDVLSQTFKNMTGRALTRPEFAASCAGRNWEDVLITFQGSTETTDFFEKATAPARPEVKAQAAATPLKPGLYEVK
jgi:hypothetical protein